MIIDFHTHIFPDKIAGATIEKLSKASDSPAYTDGTKDGLQRSMEESGVDISVVLPVVTKPQQFTSVNRYAREITPEQFCGGGEFLSFGGIHPDTENYKAEVDQIADMGLKGIKLHPDYQRVFIDDIRYMRIMDRAAERRLIVVAHAGVDVGLPEVVHCTPKRVERVLRQIDGAFWSWHIWAAGTAGRMWKSIWQAAGFILIRLTAWDIWRMSSLSVCPENMEWIKFYLQQTVPGTVKRNFYPAYGK